MSDYLWTKFFDSLDFVREATIDPAKLNVGSPDLDRLKLVALTPSLDRHRIPTWQQNGLIGFSLGELDFPVNQLVLETGDGEELLRVDGLYSADDSAYNTNFRSDAMRPKNPYLNYFLGRQLLTHFPGSSSYRIGGGVVGVYKAVELMVPEYLKEAEGFIRTSQELIPSAPVVRSPRRNREHLQLSVWCAEWHLHLATGDSDRFIECLLRIYRHLNTDVLTSYFNPAYPANKSLLMLCLYHCMLGQREEAEKVSNLAVELFKRSVRDSDLNFAHFKELEAIHKAALNCLKLVQRTEVVTPEVVDNTFRSAVRAGGTKYPIAYEAMINTLRRATRGGHEG